MSPKIRVGMIGGGGPDAFFGPVHERAINALRSHSLVAGALRTNPDAAEAAGKEWGLDHVYRTYQDLIDGAKDRNIDYVTIVTPNHRHFEPALSCLEAGVPVFCEKPLAMTEAEAETLERESHQQKIPFGVAHTYGGIYTLKLARAFVRSGVLGKVRRVVAEYLAKSGDFNCNGDINTHNHFAIRYVTGEEVTRVCCDTHIYGEDRVLDDDVDCMIRLSGGGSGLSFASQIACARQNDHRLRAYCEKGMVDWKQEDPEQLTVAIGDGPEVTFVRGGAGVEHLVDNNRVRKFCGDSQVSELLLMEKDIAWASHLPGGHGEAFFEALGNHHDNFGRCVKAWQGGGRGTIPAGFDYPTVQDGLKGMQFLAACKNNLVGNEKFTAV
jgi:predicted dehydrogenase